MKQRLKKPDLLKTPLAANSSAPTWFTARVSGLQPQFFQWNLPTYSIETTRAITHLRSVGSSPPIHEEVEDLEEVARLAQRRMLDVMLGVVLSMARATGGRMLGSRMVQMSGSTSNKWGISWDVHSINLTLCELENGHRNSWFSD